MSESPEAGGGGGGGETEQRRIEELTRSNSRLLIHSCAYKPPPLVSSLIPTTCSHTITHRNREKNNPLDFHPSVPESSRPDFSKELAYFRALPGKSIDHLNDPDHEMKTDMLLRFCHFVKVEEHRFPLGTPTYKDVEENEVSAIEVERWPQIVRGITCLPLPRFLTSSSFFADVLEHILHEFEQGQPAPLQTPTPVHEGT